MSDNVIYVSFGGDDTPEIPVRIEQIRASIERLNKLMEELRNEKRD